MPCFKKVNFLLELLDLTLSRLNILNVLLLLKNHRSEKPRRAEFKNILPRIDLVCPVVFGWSAPRYQPPQPCP